MSRTASLIGQELLERRLPGEQRALRLVRLEPIEHVPPNAEPCRTGEGAIDGLTPHVYRQLTAGRPVPRQLHDLEPTVRSAEEHRPAEQELQGNPAARECVQ